MLRTLNTVTYIKRHLDDYSNRMKSNAIALKGGDCCPFVRTLCPDTPDTLSETS
jgi:hypothetical protein